MSVPDGIHVRDYEAGALMGPHTHDEPSLNLVVGGNFRERIGLQEREYRRGHVAFCPAGVPHSQTFGRDGARQLILRPKADWLDYLTDCHVRLSESPYLNSAHFAQIGDRLCHELRSIDPWTCFACDGLLLELLAAFGRGRGRDVSGSRAPAWLIAAQEFLQENVHRPVQLESLARIVGRHPVHICREFRRHFGISVGGYVRRLRIAEAIRLIQSNELELSEIAFESGFSSHAHLCREFKRQLGMTPSEYRTNAGITPPANEGQVR
jgi:AraC family transcriptional regulator